MATRDGLQLDLIWVHLSLAHPRASDILDRAQTLIATRLPNVTMSVNRNIANTEAVVKVTSALSVFTGPLPPVVQNAIIGVYTEADHADVVAMVSTTTWAGAHEV